MKQQEGSLPPYLVTGSPPPAGRFGSYGGQFVPEVLMPALERLSQAAVEIMADGGFTRELSRANQEFIGRPTPLTECRRLGERWGVKVWLKREDLCHTGAHKINNALGQALLAARLGVDRIVAETGAGQHGVAVAAAGARVGIPCRVYMGSVDVARQSSNVARMKLLGAEVMVVDRADRTLRSAINAALQDWASDPKGSYYLLGSAVGPHPYPWMVRQFQAVIGQEAKQQFASSPGGHPDLVAACVGGGSNAIGIFHAFVGDPDVALLGVEAGGNGTSHSATLATGTPGVLHGSYAPLLQDERGQILETHSIAPGLDYPGVGPEHALLRDLGRATYVSVTDDEALDALHELSSTEGILPALESSHALAGARRWASENRGSRVVVGLSGRGDKDLDLVNGAAHHG